jgi:hypothetical protein
VDGNFAGYLAYSPYTLNLDGLADGTHRIDLTLCGTRINTFGQLHSVARGGYWWGPGSWRTRGDDWTYQYNTWPQGILKSPEVRTLK